jgi:alpha-galactosidase
MTEPASVCVVLRTEGVGLVLAVQPEGLPAVVHWGADVGALDESSARDLIRGGVNPVTTNLVDEPVTIALLPEHWTGWVGRPGLSGSRAGADWSPKFTVTALRVDDKPVVPGAGLVVVDQDGPATVEFDAVDEVARLALTLTIELTVGGLVRARAELTNTGAPYQLDDLVIALPVPPVAREIFDLAGRWGKERTPQRRELTVGTHVREGRKGRTGPDAATVLHVGQPGFGFAAGEVWALHTGWSGNHTHYTDRLSTGEQVIGGGELLLPGEIQLNQGQSYTSPWVYGSYGVGLDEVARRFHRFLRARDHHPSSKRPVTINVWEAVYFDHDLDRLIDLAERAAALGVERYVLDDGWFGSRRSDRSGLGDWQVSTEVWPDGLHPLVDKVTALGMEFGLWFEPEMINTDSDVARAHPEWMMGTGDRPPIESRFQQVINLGIDECYAYIRDAIFAVLAEYEISYIKWDHNRDLIDAGSYPSGRPGVHEQTLAFYRLVDEIKAAHPGLEIESCSSGGARVDLGVLERTDRVWASDCIDPLERQEIHRWTTQLIPPELIGAHIASGRSHTTGREHDLNFRAATAIFGHLGIEWDLSRASDAELTELADWIAFYTDHRDLLLGGDLIRIDFPDETLVATGVVATDRSQAIYCYASVARSEVVLLGRVRFPGLDPARRYRVTPTLLQHPPSGLRPPLWWGTETVWGENEYVDLAAGRHPTYVPAGDRLGVELSGAALGSVGLVAAPINPDHAMIYLVDAL